MKYKVIASYLLIQGLLPLCTMAQNQISYYYDAAGNRILREIILTQNAPASEFALTSIEEREYQDRLGNKDVVIKSDGKETVSVTLLRPSGGSVKVFDVSCKLLNSTFLETGSSTLSFSGQPAGVYVLQITTGQDKTNWKIGIR